MGDKIEISDKGETKVQFNEEFDDVDLLSDEEKEALAEDVDLDGPKAEKSDADSHSREEARQKAEDEAKKAAAEAKAKADEEAKKADEDKKALQEAETAKEAKEKTDASADKTEDEGKTADEEPAKIVPDTAPPTVLQGLTDEQLKEVQDGLAKAKKDFQEGVIDYDEYLDQRDQFNQQIWQHNLAVQMSSESVDTRWEWEQETFLTAQENAWINDDEVIYRAFAATVNAILSTEEGSVMPGPDILANAREEVAKRFSPQGQQERIDQEEQSKKKAALENAKATEAAKQAPETLGGKPAAEIDEGVGEFDWLDKLDGEAYEQAVSNLTEAQLKRYEANV